MPQIRQADSAALCGSTLVKDCVASCLAAKSEFDAFLVPKQVEKQTERGFDIAKPLRSASTSAEFAIDRAVQRRVDQACHAYCVDWRQLRRPAGALRIGNAFSR
jgi:hypothetical protein